MSDTESFEYALWKAIDDCKIDENADTITGSYIKSLSNQDRVVAAHIREIRDTAQQQYHRGFEDGRHSMDAERRAIAMRLRQLPRGCRGYSDAHISWFADLAWAMGIEEPTFASLRDELVRLMGGVSDGICCRAGGGACAAGDSGCAGEQKEVGHERPADDCGADTGCGSDDIHMAEVSDGRTGANGVTEPIGRNDERGDDCDGRDSVEQTEVGDGRTGDSYARRHPCRGVGRNDMCVGRDSGEHSRGQEVEHGGAAHDCAADSSGGTGSELVHMDGIEPTATVTGDGLTITSEDGDELRIVKDDILLNGKSIVKESIDGFLGLTATYDVLDNERHKAVCELRKLPEQYKDDGKRSPAGRFNEALGDAIGVEGLPSFAKIRDRLIYLLGGDKTNGIDVMREMDSDETSLNDDGTCPNDDTTSSITDELRKYVAAIWDGSMYVNQVPMELLAIADRIDEQFDRICQQQEAVLQETIDEMVDERDHWKELSDMYSNMLLRISSKNVSLKAECDELRDEDVKIKRQYAKLCVERADLLDLLRDARDEYKLLDQMSAETSSNFHAMRDKVWGLEAERDELQEELDGYEQTHMKLPRDKDGTYIRVADTVRINDRKYGVYAVSNKNVWLNPFDDDLYRLYGYPADECSVVKKGDAING